MPKIYNWQYIYAFIRNNTMATTKIDREYALDLLQQNILSKDNILLNNIFRLILLETDTDPRRDNILNASSKTGYIVMQTFLLALQNYDFETMKILLPRMFDTHINLHEVYFKYLRDSSSVMAPNEVAKFLHDRIMYCQKTLVNKTNFDEKDVWLLVMLECLRPVAGLTTLSNNLKWALGGLSELKYSNSNRYTASKYEAECEIVKYKLIDLTTSYRSKSIDLLKILSKEEENLKNIKKDMEWQNTLFNIINVFAWLPLLLTNIKRACCGQPLRLFRYTGITYGKKLANSMIEVLSPKMDQLKSDDPLFQNIINGANRIKGALLFNIINSDITPDINLLKNFFAKNKKSFSNYIDHEKIIKVLGNEAANFVFKIYTLQETYLYIKKEKNINLINNWLNHAQTKFSSDSQLIEIVKRLIKEKNILVINYLDNKKYDVINLLIDDNEYFKEISDAAIAAVRNNQHAMNLIRQLVISTIPIKIDDFNLFKNVTSGLNKAVTIMNKNFWGTKELFEVVLKTYSTWDIKLREKLETEQESFQDIESTIQDDVAEQLRTLCTEYTLNLPSTLKVSQDEIKVDALNY